MQCAVTLLLWKWTRPLGTLAMFGIGTAVRVTLEGQGVVFDGASLYTYVCHVIDGTSGTSGNFLSRKNMRRENWKCRIGERKFSDVPKGGHGATPPTLSAVPQAPGYFLNTG